MEKIKVILSCPQVIFREGIHFILSGEEDFEVVGETTENMETLELIESNPPHIVILSQPGVKSDIADITRRIKSNYPAISVVLITDSMDSTQLFPIVVSSISAVFTPDIDPDKMVSLLRDTARGRLPVIDVLSTPAFAARTLADFKDLATLNERLGITMAQLTKKEAEILTSLASGDVIGQAAGKSGLFEEAAMNHLRTIFQKLTVNDRSRLIIEKTQMSIASLIPAMPKDDSSSQEYLTLTEFNEFKTALMSGFKSFVSEKA